MDCKECPDKVYWTWCVLCQQRQSGPKWSVMTPRGPACSLECASRYGHSDSLNVKSRLVCRARKHHCGTCGDISKRLVCIECQSPQVFGGYHCWMGCQYDSDFPPPISDEERIAGQKLCECFTPILDFSRRISFLERGIVGKQIKSLPGIPGNEHRLDQILSRILGPRVSGLVVQFCESPSPTKLDLANVCSCLLSWKIKFNLIDSSKILDSPIARAVHSDTAYIVSGNETFLLTRGDGHGLTHGDVFRYFRQMSNGILKWIDDIPVLTLEACSYIGKEHSHVMDVGRASSSGIGRVLKSTTWARSRNVLFKSIEQNISYVKRIMTPSMRDSILTSFLDGVCSCELENYQGVFELGIGGRVDIGLLRRSISSDDELKFDAEFARIIESIVDLSPYHAQGLRDELWSLGPLSKLALEGVLGRQLSQW